MKKFLIFSICILLILTVIFLVKSSPGGSGQVEKTDVAYISGEKEGENLKTPEGREALEGEYTEEIIERDISFGDDPEMDPQEETEEDEEQREILPEFNDVLKVNPYVAGWLKIDDSVIDDPVVYTPKSQNYFLHRALDGSDNESGTLFIANLWRDGYNNTLIYGHNMKDGRGFGSLGKYSSEKYGRDHSTLEFYTLFEKKEYELLGVFYSSIEEEELETDEQRQERDQEIEEESIGRKQEEEASASTEETASDDSEEGSGNTEEEESSPGELPVTLTLEDLHLYEDFGDIDVYREEKDQDMERGDFRYYYFTDLTYKEDYDYFVENVKKNSLYDTGVDAEWGDELITLSTCSYQTKNGRFVVVAKRK